MSHMCNCVVVVSSLCVWTKLAYLHIMPKILVGVLQLGKHSLQVKGGQIGIQTEKWLVGTTKKGDHLKQKELTY